MSNELSGFLSTPEQSPTCEMPASLFDFDPDPFEHSGTGVAVSNATLNEPAAVASDAWPVSDAWSASDAWSGSDNGSAAAGTGPPSVSTELLATLHQQAAEQLGLDAFGRLVQGGRLIEHGVAIAPSTGAVESSGVGARVTLPGPSSQAIDRNRGDYLKYWSLFLAIKFLGSGFSAFRYAQRPTSVPDGFGTGSKFIGSPKSELVLDLPVLAVLVIVAACALLVAIAGVVLCAAAAKASSKKASGNPTPVFAIAAFLAGLDAVSRLALLAVGAFGAIDALLVGLAAATTAGFLRARQTSGGRVRR